MVTDVVALQTANRELSQAVDNMQRALDQLQQQQALQTPLNLSSSEIIATYVYKNGLLDANYSFAAAVGLFNSVINFLLILIVNFIAKRVSDTSLF